MTLFVFSDWKNFAYAFLTRDLFIGIFNTFFVVLLLQLKQHMTEGAGSYATVNSFHAFWRFPLINLEPEGQTRWKGNEKKCPKCVGANEKREMLCWRVLRVSVYAVKNEQLLIKMSHNTGSGFTKNKGLCTVEVLNTCSCTCSEYLALNKLHLVLFFSPREQQF